MKKFNCFLPFLLQKIIYIIFYPLYLFFLRIKIEGKENLSSLSGPIILAPNHTSELDPTVIPLVLSFFSRLSPIYSVIYPKEKYNVTSFGWRAHIYSTNILEWLGGYSVFSGHKNYAIALDNHVKLIRKGRTVCIFPEGKCTLDGQINPARGGLGYLAYVTNAFVVPIAIDTLFNISFVDFILRRRTLTISVGKPIHIDKLISPQIHNPSVEDFRHASQVVLDKIKEMMQ